MSGVDACVCEDLNELDAIEAELERLRDSGDLTCGKEIELMRKELSVLKRCCENLTSMQAGNKRSGSPGAGTDGI